jgi:hypothetical protein
MKKKVPLKFIVFSVTIGYAILVNGIRYDETNPTGVETIMGGAANGCDSIVTINLTFSPDPCKVAIGNVVFP